MYRTTIHAAPRRILRAPVTNSSKRFLSTGSSTNKSRSWKSSAARWALAAGGVYYYNTSTLFAEEPESAINRLGDSIHAIEVSKEPTIDEIIEEKRKRYAEKVAENKKGAEEKVLAARDEQVAVGGAEEESEESLEALEGEAGQQGAFNEETGEINWDCPCLGGMAHGPCGEEFKAAFSCFVYSDQEPKGVECIDKFQGMQDCFRQHPEVYASELQDDEDDDIEEELSTRREAKDTDEHTEQSESSTATSTTDELKEPSETTPIATTPAVNVTEKKDTEDAVVPKAAHDASQ